MRDSPIKRLAINTGGGDAPGLNAVIRAVVIAALNRGWEVAGIREGYNGLLEPERFPEGGLMPLTADTVRGITHLGGTILGTTNRGNPLRWPTTGPNGEVVEIDRSDELVARFQEEGLDALVAVGGDGSLAIADTLHQKGLRVVGVPKTIDNDLDQTVVTFGFDTAVSFAVQCLDRLHSTAQAHRRVMVVEVMGRDSGWIALYSGISGGADAILIPEIPFSIDRVCEKISDNELHDKHYAIIVVAEGAKSEDGRTIARGKGEPGRQEVILGGVGEWVADEIRKRLDKDVRSLVLGHLQRGGSPTTFDRLLALRFGAAAVRMAEARIFDHMVAWTPPEMSAVPLVEAIRSRKKVDLTSDKVMTAREIGICFGD